MIINKHMLLEAAPIKNMLDHKVQGDPTSYGLVECGYDIRIKQEVAFSPGMGVTLITASDGGIASKRGNFVLGSSIEEFQMPNHLMGRVLNKSTWARKGLDASMTTNIEPGWNGHLTIELLYHGHKDLIIPAGSGICQVIFETVSVPVAYVGKYQNQADKPVEAIMQGKPICSADGCSRTTSCGPFCRDRGNL